MAEASYPKAIAFVLKQEGGYTNDPKDPGGPTNWGITIFDAKKYWKPEATAADVRAMPLEVARTIYQDKYWKVVSGPDLPAGLDLCTFDSAVNSGTGRANKWLATSIPCTLRSYADMAVLARSAEPIPAIDRYCNTRLSFLHSLRTWDHFGKGWGSRVASLRATAKVLSLQASGKPTSEIKSTLGIEVAKTKAKQTGDLAKATTANSTQIAAHYSFWHWDLLHVGVLVVGVVFGLYLIRKVVQNLHQVKAYEDAIGELHG